MIATIIICTILIIGSLVGCVFWIKSLLQGSYKEIGEIVEDKITAANDIPQVALDNYIGEIISSVKAEIKEIKLGKKITERFAEDLKTALLGKLDKEYLKSEKNDNTQK